MNFIDYGNITSSNYITSTNYTDYDKLTLTNCTNNENNIVIFIPTFLLTKPCGLSFLSLMRLMEYTIIKPLFNSK